MKKIEKDIELAKKTINGEIDELFSYIYPFTTENIKFHQQSPIKDAVLIYKKTK